MRKLIKDFHLFSLCLSEAAKNKELLAEFDRLTGYNISLKGPAIVQEIDRATGHLEKGARAFYDFIFEYLYLPAQAAVDKSGDR